MKNVFLYLMVFVYAAGGINHFVNPGFYESIMPIWLPEHALLNSLAGGSEIIFSALLLPKKTRIASAQLIMAMLSVFLVMIHVPMVKEFYKSNHPGLLISIIRLPIQFVLIWWAWYYTQPLKAEVNQ